MSASHDEYALLLAGYALDALDDRERRVFEDHLSGCTQCQEDLRDFQRVNAGLGIAGGDVAPPVELRAKTLARATALQQRPAEPRTFTSRRSTGRRASDQRREQSPGRPSRALAWFAAAASVAAVLSATYGWSLRDQLRTAQSITEDASQRALMLAREVEKLRVESAGLVQRVRVLSAPDLIRVDLKGQPTAPNAVGRAFLSASSGLFFNARDLPALPADKAYQLWVIADGKPVSVGMISADASGALTLAGSLQPELSTVSAVAVTAEPASGSQTPTMPIVLMGPLPK
jgi:anti-sigma-K factor RskA